MALYINGEKQGGAEGDITPDSVTVGLGTAGDPSVSAGTGVTGWYWISDTEIALVQDGTVVFKTNGTYIGGLSGSRWAINHGVNATDTVPTFLPRGSGDPNTGLGAGPGSDSLSLIVGGVNGIELIENGGILVLSQITAGITADTGSSQGDGPLTSSINQISVCANVGDAVTYPSAVAGYLVELYNDGANACDVFPASGDNLGAGVDTAVSLAAGANITRRAIDTTNWKART